MTMLLLMFNPPLLFILTVSSLIMSAEAQVCPANGILAGIETSLRNNDAVAGRYMLNGKGTINCYGVIREWIFHTNDLCNAGDIYFEVWRPGTAAGDYVLVGVNKFSPADCPVAISDVTFGVAPFDRIPVEPGYIIGWLQPNPPNPPRISADPPASTSAGEYSTAASTSLLNPGVTQTFTDQPTPQDFSLKVTVTKGDYPTIDNLPATVNLAENNISPPLIVFTVIASHVGNIHTFKDAVQLSFAMSPVGAPFTIQNTTSNGVADVTATGPIDYEAQNVYQLTITVTGLGLSTSKVLTVNIVDVNEEHNITNLPATISIAAPSIPAASEIFQVLISESDANPFVPLKFYLKSWTSPDTVKDTPPFIVNPDTGSVTSSTDLSIWHLNYPTGSPYPVTINYTLTILATDGVFNKQDNLTIEITNVKQPPVFLNLPNTITIDENLPGNADVYQVLVEFSADPVRYDIIDPLTPFCIDEDSGLVSLCSYAKLDFCHVSQYSIRINATNYVQSSVDWLNVSLQWINSPPSFTQSTYTGTIDEECRPTPNLCAQRVTTIAAVDRDPACIPPNDTLSCSIVPGVGSTYFTIPAGCGSVVNNQPIDLDNNPQFEHIVLLIEVRDSKGLTAYSKVVIEVHNTNDFSPSFIPSGSYLGSVVENAPGGTSVLTVTATDGDSGINGDFVYSILSTDPASQYFEVDRTTGLIKTKQPLDREAASSYNFSVYATDKGSSPETGSAIVTVNVIDVNDVRPEIVCSNRPSDEPYLPLPCFYNFDLKYDALIGQNVSTLTLSATDVDPKLNTIKFNLLVPDETFNLDNQSGLISLKKPAKEYTKYLLYVYAEDNGNPSLWSRIMNVRIDTYRPDRQYIDLTVRPKTSTFDQTAFLAALRNVTYPWFMKIASQTHFDPNVQKELIVTVYALADTSTYLPENIVYQKVFVDRDDMLNRLRTNIYGDPADILNVPMLEDEFPIIKVMPTYVNWWLDTIEGIATIVCLSILGLLFLILIGVGICKCFKLLCFKEKTPAKPVHAWVDDKPKTTVRSNDEESVRYRSAHGRRESVSTVHSVILDKDL